MGGMVVGVDNQQWLTGGGSWPNGWAKQGWGPPRLINFLALKPGPACVHSTAIARTLRCTLSIAHETDTTHTCCLSASTKCVTQGIMPVTTSASLNLSDLLALITPTPPEVRGWAGWKGAAA